MKKTNIIEFSLSEIAFLLLFIVLIIYFISIPKNKVHKIDESETLFPIPSEILFDTGDAKLKEEAKKELSKISSEILNVIETKHYSNWEIRIEGHTDNRPISTYCYESNWDLSSARAISVVQYFVSQGIFPPDRLQAMGYGETKPLVSNTSSENMKKNRRVEIKLINRPK